MIRIFQVKTQDPKDIEKQILKKLNMPSADLLSWKIHRKSVDARGQKVHFSYVIDADVKHEKKYLRHKDVKPAPDERFVFEPAGFHELENRPLVIGFGPAGMFASILLAQYGYKPVIVERGGDIEKRQKDVDRFWKEGILDPQSNVQFGMGGAGAFSDGKLTSRSKDLKSRKIFEELIKFGADPDIAIEQHPHVGTDGFIKILKNMRAEIERLGGIFLFDTRLEDIETEDGKLVKAKLSNGQTVNVQAMIVGCGHSAEDTIVMLEKAGVLMQPKPFAVGARIEHDQQFINKAMLKDRAFDPALIPARYQLTHTAKNGKGVYSFCMCPGGYVIPSSSAENSIVVNGMSYSDRAGKQANAALLVQVGPEDYGNALFDGMKFQKEIEEKAYQISNSYKVPAQSARDYLSRSKSSSFENVTPTYELGYMPADLNTLFPEKVNEALHEALEAFEKKVPGFLDDAVLSAPETRSSSSVRFQRDSETLMSTVKGLYPCGEGAGFAGGIVSSAIDGLKAAMALMDYFDRPVNAELE
jgi:hypothetical protein